MKESIGDANRKGFYESKLRYGINYHNNPNPDNGVSPSRTDDLDPIGTCPGLLKIDFAFIHRVVAIIRPWNEYSSSIERLLDMEDEYIVSQPEKRHTKTVRQSSVVRIYTQHLSGGVISIFCLIP